MSKVIIITACLVVALSFVPNVIICRAPVENRPGHSGYVRTWSTYSWPMSPILSDVTTCTEGYDPARHLSMTR